MPITTFHWVRDLAYWYLRIFLQLADLALQKLIQLNCLTVKKKWQQNYLSLFQHNLGFVHLNLSKLWLLSTCTFFTMADWPYVTSEKIHQLCFGDAFIRWHWCYREHFQLPAYTKYEEKKHDWRTNCDPSHQNQPVVTQLLCLFLKSSNCLHSNSDPKAE